MSIKNYLQKRLINILVKDLFNTISVEDVISVKQERDKKTGRIIRRVFSSGRELDAHALNLLKQDAEKFNRSSLWKLLSNVVKYNANLRMYEKGKTNDDILAGKCSLWTLKIIEKAIDDIQNKI